MKIKNELVNIKIGNKNYNFNNLILDTYLKRFAKSQLDIAKIGELENSKILESCLLKFDTPLQSVSTSSIIYNNNFDVVLVGVPKIQQTLSENQIIAEYTYNSQYLYDYLENKEKKVEDYYDRKITAIGFNVNWVKQKNENNNLPILAILDTSNYNIYLQESQELNITRKDIMTTDALFYSNDKTKIPGPAHLAPLGLPKEINKNFWNYSSEYYHSFLDSVGLSSYVDYIDKEFLVGQDIDIQIDESKLNINGIENYISTDNSLFSNLNIYPNINLYPLKSNYKYIILKYRVFQSDREYIGEDLITTPVDTGYYYHQAIPIDKFGKSNLQIKYERG